MAGTRENISLPDERVFDRNRSGLFRAALKCARLRARWTDHTDGVKPHPPQWSSPQGSEIKCGQDTKTASVSHPPEEVTAPHRPGLSDVCRP